MSPIHRAMGWCLVVGLCIQLIAFTQHHHELTAHPDDCVACYLTALSSDDGTPPSSPIVMALPRVRTFAVVVQRESAVSPPFRSFIRPFPQAPPRI